MRIAGRPKMSAKSTRGIRGAAVCRMAALIEIATKNEVSRMTLLSEEKDLLR